MRKWILFTRKHGKYSRGSRSLHWVIALLVLTMLSLSFFLEDLPNNLQPIGYMIHKSCGLTVLFLMCLRIIWVVGAGKPNLPDGVARGEVIFARLVQYSLYVLLLAMPISGWVMSVAANRVPTYFGLFRVNLPIEPDKELAQFMSETHGLIAWTLIVLIFLHVAGALKHYLYDRDKVMQSMLPDSVE